MKQLELGNKVNEIRNAKGFTQKELSDSCNVDIRTIQRIEAGEVIPRWSTIRIIAAALEIDEKVFDGNKSGDMSPLTRQILYVAFMCGIIYFIKMIFHNNIIPGVLASSNVGLLILISVIHLITGVMFYYGFYHVGKYKQNKILEIASIIIVVLIPLYVITDMIILSTAYSFTIHLKRLLVIQLGIAGIIFGIGLLNAKSKHLILYKFSGFLQILIGPMLIIQAPFIQMIGLWLSIPLILLLLGIIFLEYIESKTES